MAMELFQPVIISAIVVAANIRPIPEPSMMAFAD